MPKQTLEHRLTKLEQQVAILIGSRKSVEKFVGGANGGRQPLVSRNKWQQTLGVFGPEDGMDEVFNEAMKLREGDRRQARKAAPAKKATAKPSRTRKLVQS